MISRRLRAADFFYVLVEKKTGLGTARLYVVFLLGLGSYGMSWVALNLLRSVTARS